MVVGLSLALAPLAVSAGRAPAYVIGAKTFAEQYILAELMGMRLEKAGARVELRQDLGSVIAFRALAANDLDAYVDYSGTLWTTVLGHTDTPPRQVLLDRMTRELRARYGVVVLGPLGFENAYALAMRRDAAARLGVASIADLAPHAPQLSLGSDLEFLSRPEWRALKSAYGLHFKAERSYQPTFMYRAVAGGEADVISAFSSDGRIAADDLVTLTDPKGAIPPYDAVILISPKRAGDARLRQALLPLIGRISVATMRAANLTVDRDKDKLTPAQAAQVLGRGIGSR
jgi:osmoprotectant transport system permease protein